MYAVLPGTGARALLDHLNTLPNQRLELLAELVCKTKQLHGLIRDKSTSLFIQMLQFCSQSLPACLCVLLGFARKPIKFFGLAITLFKRRATAR